MFLEQTTQMCQTHPKHQISSPVTDRAGVFASSSCLRQSKSSTQEMILEIGDVYTPKGSPCQVQNPTASETSEVTYQKVNSKGAPQCLEYGSDPLSTMYPVNYQPKLCHKQVIRFHQALTRNATQMTANRIPLLPQAPLKQALCVRPRLIWNEASEKRPASSNVPTRGTS